MLHKSFRKSKRRKHFSFGETSITLTPKQGKHYTKLNFRPVSLMNICKNFNKILANQIQYTKSIIYYTTSK